MNIYVDSSFLVSLYIPDANSPEAELITHGSTGAFIVTDLCELEVINALSLRVFRKQAAAGDAHIALHNLDRDLQEGLLEHRRFPDGVFERAGQLSRQTTAKLGTRTADLLHVAAALELGADYLYSFDQQQRKLAQNVRLKLN